jgi:hypothetical protein
MVVSFQCRGPCSDSQARTGKLHPSGLVFCLSLLSTQESRTCTTGHHRQRDKTLGSFLMCQQFPHTQAHVDNPTGPLNRSTRLANTCFVQFSGAKA